MSALFDTGLDWAHTSSTMGVMGVGDPPTSDPTTPTEVSEVLVTAKKGGLVYSGYLSLSDMAPHLEDAGISAANSHNVGYSIAAKVMTSLGGKELSTVGAAVNTTTLPSGYTMLDSALLMYPGNSNTGAPNVAVIYSQDTTFARAYIDIDSNGVWDRVVDLGFYTG